VGRGAQGVSTAPSTPSHAVFPAPVTRAG